SKEKLLHWPAFVPPASAPRRRSSGWFCHRPTQPGDAYIELAVRPHRLFRRDGDDIRLDLPISLSEAVLGGRVEVPTPTGTVAMNLPKGTNTGKVMRLRGKGVARPDGSRGDLYAELRVVLPENDPELAAFVEGWKAGQKDNPRRGLEV
ncbi:DnaJ C-terminal domain-containing protein, partial [Methylobacterium oxalidis]|uniref:DnaJ C-terminal domain-containing protein n=1 Tax=Methylobacterium oxalidis TaxID=944322 RepID=UPI003315303F